MTINVGINGFGRIGRIVLPPTLNKIISLSPRCADFVIQVFRNALRNKNVVIKAINDPSKVVIGFVAPAVRSVIAAS